MSYSATAARVWRARRARGEDTSLVRVKHIKTKLIRWHSWGFSGSAIASATSVSQPTVDNIRQGRSYRASREVFEELRNLDYLSIFDSAESKMLVPKYPSVRRLQALARIGWTKKAVCEVASRYGVPEKTVEKITTTSSPSIYAQTHRAIELAYEELSGTVGSNDRARRRAEKLGWAPPLAWDNPNDRNEKPKI